MMTTTMTLIDYIFASITLALLIGFVVMVLEYRQLWRDHRKLQNRCWGLQREVLDEDEDRDEDRDENEDRNRKEKDNDDEETYH